MNKEELIERIEDFPCEASLVAEMIRINKNTLLGWVKELDEPQKVKIPDFVAEWIEYCKAHDFTLFGCIDLANDFEDLADETFKGDIRKCIRWCRRESNIFARAWLDGYTVEKEKRYRVKLKGINSESEYLYYGMRSCTWRFGEKNESGYFRKNHTRKELEEAGFGWVFDCEGIELEEVEE